MKLFNESDADLEGEYLADKSFERWLDSSIAALVRIRPAGQADCRRTAGRSVTVYRCGAGLRESGGNGCAVIDSVVNQPADNVAALSKLDPLV